MVAVLVWPALVNGAPFLYPDSVAYVRGPDVALSRLWGPGAATEWALHDPRSPEGSGESDSAGAGQPSYADREVMAGRSIYYGLLAYAGARTGGFWLTAVVQALVVLGCIVATCRAFGVRDPRVLSAVVLLIAMATAAPFFTSFAMPDIWAAVAIVGLSLIAARGGRLGAGTLALTGGLVVYAAAAHTSHVLVIFMVMVGSLVMVPVAGARLANARRAALVGCLAIAIALLGDAAFNFAVKQVYGAEPIRPPHLTARVVADGPGADFVANRCDETRFEVCRHRDRLPMPADVFLWDQEEGVFQTVDARARRALSEEQFRFGWAVFRSQPVGQVRASTVNAARQVVRVDLESFNYSDDAKQAFARLTPPGYRDTLEESLAFQGGWPVGRLAGLHTALLVISLGVLLIAGAAGVIRRARDGRPRSGGEDRRPILVFAVLILLGILGNAFVCGALSEVHGRYQARVAWLIVLPATVMLASWMRKEPEISTSRRAAG